LDGKECNTITAYLFHTGSDNDPKRLHANAGLTFAGYYNYGTGFTFDDEVEGAESLETMHMLLGRDPQQCKNVFFHLLVEQKCFRIQRTHPDGM